MAKSKEELEALVKQLKKEKAEYEEYVERQVTHLIGTISDVALGDFSVSAKYERKDDLGALAEGINMMIEEVKGAVEAEAKVAADKARAEEAEKMKAELEAKVKELEAFHDVAVGRELKMKKMEKEMEELRKKVT